MCVEALFCQIWSHLLWTNSVCWVECLNLVLLCAGETCNTSTTSTQCCDSLKVEQAELIYNGINWLECLHIAACWRDTQYKHCCISCDSLKVEKSICYYYWMECLHALSIIAMCWRDMQHKHCIYCCDHWRPRMMKSDDHPLNKSLALHIPT